MRAAVVTSFGTPPRYEDIDAPTPGGPADVVVDVVAAGLHPRVRSQADGSHYTSTDELPLIPGIDGVGRGPDRRLRYSCCRTQPGDRWRSGPWSTNGAASSSPRTRT